MHTKTSFVCHTLAYIVSSFFTLMEVLAASPSASGFYWSFSLPTPHIKAMPTCKLPTQLVEPLLHSTTDGNTQCLLRQQRVPWSHHSRQRYVGCQRESCSLWPHELAHAYKWAIAHSFSGIRMDLRQGRRADKTFGGRHGLVSAWDNPLARRGWWEVHGPSGSHLWQHGVAWGSWRWRVWKKKGGVTRDQFTTLLMPKENCKMHIDAALLCATFPWYAYLA